MDPITLAALGAGLKSAGVAAAIPLAARGVAAALPSARAKRKLDRKLLEDAVDRVQRGEEYGFGPSRRRRSRMVAQRMRQYDAANAGQREALERQQALQGLGRSGFVGQQMREMANQRAGVRANTRQAVEDEARSIARYNERMARRDLAQQRGVQQQRVDDNVNFATELVTGAALYGIKAGKDAKDAAEKATFTGADEVAADVAPVSERERSVMEYIKRRKAMSRSK